MKKLTCFVLSACIFIACNSPEQNTTTGNTEDSTTIKASDSGEETRGDKGMNNGGGLSDTTHKTDTLSHSSTPNNR